MIKRLLFILVACLGLSAISAAPSFAQATRTWVSGVGDDANPCSRTAPCKTFAGAISKTAVAGEINCLDPGGFGGVTITKAITLNCQGTLGSVLVAGTNGIVINVASNGNSGIVVLNGLEIEGISSGTNGINIISADRVIINRVQVRDFTTTCLTYAASLANIRIDVADSYFSNCGATSSTTSNAAINIAPTGSGNANASLTGLRIDGSANGLNIDGASTTGAVFAALTNSTISGNQGVGVRVNGTNAGKMRLMVDKSVISNNNVGEKVSGAMGLIRTNSSAITGNGTGVQTDGLGQLNSYGNNALNANVTADGTFTSVTALQ